MAFLDALAGVVSFYGYIASETQAAAIFEATRSGQIRLLLRRLGPEEQTAISAGHGFVYDEHLSEIKRWSDGRVWTDSSSRGAFLLYKECLVQEQPDGKRIKVEKINGLRKKSIADRTPGSSLRLVFYYDAEYARIPHR